MRQGGSQNPFSAYPSGTYQGGPPAQSPSGQCNFIFFANLFCKRAHCKSMQQQGRASSPAPGLLNPLQKSWCLTCPCVCTKTLISFKTAETEAVALPLHLLQNILCPGGCGMEKPLFFLLYVLQSKWPLDKQFRLFSTLFLKRFLADIWLHTPSINVIFPSLWELQFPFFHLLYDTHSPY